MHILIQPKSSLTGENGLKWESFIGRLERDKFSFSQQLRKSHNLLSCFVFESYCKKDKRNIFNVEKSSEDHVSCRAGPRQNSFAELEKVKNRSTFQFVCILLYFLEHMFNFNIQPIVLLLCSMRIGMVMTMLMLMDMMLKVFFI